MTNIKGIVLVVIDALRKDVYEDLKENRLLSNLKKLEGRAIAFDRAYALVNATDPSLTTILTGRHPLSHGIIHHGSKITNNERARTHNIVLLSEYLLNNDWFTAAVDFLNRWHSRGFLKYSHREPHVWMKTRYFIRALLDDKLRTYSRDILLNRGKSPFSNPYLDADMVSEQAIKYLSHALKTSKRFFILIHYWSTHIPYFSNSEIFKYMKNIVASKSKLHVKNKPLEEILNSIGNKKWRHYLAKWFNTMNYSTVYDVIASYYAAVKYVDESFGKIINFLESQGILDKTLIIVTGDHGESLGEHNIYFDHHGLYQVSLRIPLLFYFEPLGGDRRKEVVMHNDIVPTIMDLLNKRYPTEIDGFSLLDYHKDDRPVISIETHTQEKIAVVYNDYKLIESINKEKAVCEYCGIIHGGLRELYNLKSDPLEEQNIYDDGSNVVKELRKILAKPRIKFKTLLIKYSR